MSVPAKSRVQMHSPGLMRSALLMRALGAKAASVWSQLSPKEAEHLSQAMQTLPEDAEGEHQAVAAYVQSMRASPEPEARTANGIWGRLSAYEGAQLANLLQSESPQIIALTLSRLSSEAAADAVRALPRALATESLKRLLNLGDVHPAAIQVIASSLDLRLSRTQTQDHTGGHERVARIFDSLDQGSETELMSSLNQAEPGAGEKIRALMFTFEDLAALDPASLQTILGSVDRAVLTLALKGASVAVADAFFNNVTQRAAELLRDDMAGIGPIRRSEVDAARAEVLAVARTLLKRGELLRTEDDDELVE
jgi:flagellar motor switch protein FliG